MIFYIEIIIFICIILYLSSLGCEENETLPDQVPPELSLVGFTDSTILPVEGIVTITADANVTAGANALTLATGTAQAITWSEIIPGATMTWTPIDPT